MTRVPTQPDPAPTATPPLLLVTGLSGAGRSTAINALEDLGFETIDNLPLRLIPRLLDGPPMERPMALGIAPSTRGFTPDAVLALLEELGPAQAPSLVYLDCRAEVLVRRYSETRRRHPFAPADSPVDGIAGEAELMVPVRERSDVLIDTSDLSIHDLRAEIDRLFGGPEQSRLTVTIQSFSYKKGLPRGLDLVFDCRFLRNPYWDDALRSGDGRNPDVAAYIAQDKRYAPFLERLRALIDLVLPAHVEEGKRHLAIGFGCTGGRHRSVCVTQALSQALAEAGWQVSIRHRELGAQASGAATGSPDLKGERG